VRKSDFNILLFLALYFLFKEGFYFYVGLTSPGGKLFSPFLSQFANIPYWLSALVTGGSKLLLKIAGYAAYQKNPTNITITGGGGVNIAWGCLGVGAISLWIAFVIAHRWAVKHKVKWIAAGIVFIFVVNILRISTIALSYYYNWKYLRSFNVHTSFNALTYAVILIFMLFFTLQYNRQKNKVVALH
jgi:exosortase/archaeosortase family protein